MAFLATPGSWIDAGSGLLLIGLGLFVARLHPRRRANLALAAFSVLFGVAYLVSNLYSVDDPASQLGRGVFPFLQVGGAVALAAVAVLFPRPLTRHERRLLALPLALTGAWMLVELWGELTFGGVDNDLFGDLAFAGFLATFLGALLLFAARAARSAEGRDVQRYALLSAALLMYPAVFIGMSSVPTPEGIAAGLAALRTSFGLSGLAAGVALWSLFLVGNGLLILGVLAVLWLRIARAGGGAPARSARDVAWLALGLPLLGAILEVWLEGVVGPWPAPLNAGPLGLSRTIAVLILAYAMLRHQLLDIDVKVRWTIQQSTIAAAFIGVFFVVSESAQTLLAGSVGPYLGIAAAGLLLFAMAPLQRAAERVAGAAVPHARRQLPPEERAALYRDTARMAWADGRLTPDERRLLDGLRERLGLSADEASRLEREVLPGPTF